MPLIAVAQLADRIAAGDPSALLDVRWELASGAQRERFVAGRVPGAAFVDLDRDLADPAGVRGRHPLPDPSRFGESMRAAGVRRNRPVVVYDACGGLAAARAWWLLRFHGHPDVRVLDGGLTAWTAAGGEVETGEPPAPASGDFEPSGGAMPVLDAEAAGALATGAGGVLIDARAPERFRGEVEPMDRVAGHIPGARNVPMAALLRDDGRLREPAALRSAFAQAGADGGETIGAYCGSGITAAHTVLALERAGMRGALYPGSWSEWVTDATRPVATGS